MANDLRDVAAMLPLPWAEREVVWSDDEHYQIEVVKDPFDCGLEGYMLGHCLGDKAPWFFHNHRVFSLRDKEGVPHATLLYASVRNISPYGRSCDFGNATPMRQGSEQLHLLQVRGRNDALARLEYHRLARIFHRANGGGIHMAEKYLDRACVIHGDTDVNYHYGYILDERTNVFNPNFWKEQVSG